MFIPQTKSNRNISLKNLNSCWYDKISQKFFFFDSSKICNPVPSWIIITIMNRKLSNQKFISSFNFMLFIEGMRIFKDIHIEHFFFKNVDFWNNINGYLAKIGQTNIWFLVRSKTWTPNWDRNPIVLGWWLDKSLENLQAYCNVTWVHWFI